MAGMLHAWLVADEANSAAEPAASEATLTKSGVEPLGEIVPQERLERKQLSMESDAAPAKMPHLSVATSCVWCDIAKDNDVPEIENEYDAGWTTSDEVAALESACEERATTALEPKAKETREPSEAIEVIWADVEDDAPDPRRTGSDVADLPFTTGSGGGPGKGPLAFRMTWSEKRKEKKLWNPVFAGAR